MAFEPSLAEQELLADTIRRSRSAVTGRQRFAEILVGGGFVAAVAAIWALNPPHGLHPAATLMCVAVMALSSRVRFDTPLGFTVPTQLAFVPLLFATPLALVPVAVAAALAISRLPDVVAGRVPVAKLLRALGNSWFSVGPVVVFSVAQVAPADAGPLLLIVALCAQFACDFSVSAVYFGIARSASVRSQMRDSWVYVIDAALSCVGLVVAEQMSSSAVAVLAVVPLLGLLAMFAHERKQRLESLLELNDTYRGTALLLADVVSADDGYTGEHSRGVVGLALAVGTQLGLGLQRQRNLEFGALLHDVGKISIPKEIINKPGKLDPDEWELIKTHTLEGQRMLSRVGGFMHEVGRIVRSHHERWDGGGYPDGLAGDAIPLAARIISCCDAWNAMRTDRSYRRALSYETAMAQLRSNSGTQFDPDVVQVLVAIVGADAPALAPDAPALGSDAPAPGTSERVVVPVADREPVAAGVAAGHGLAGDLALNAALTPDHAAG